MIPENVTIQNKELPNSPGVYLMKNATGKILYIGKAASLKKRVTSYFQKSHEYRIERLIHEVRRIDYYITDTAIEALILESKLIKKHQPLYNVRDKDDKSFWFVEITREPFPRILLVRGKDVAKSKRFGPFTSATSIKETLKLLRRIFPWATHPAEKIGTYTRPCFEYEIGKCPGTCINAISKTDYRKNITYVRAFLEGKKKRLIQTLKKRMHEASKALKFEKAETLKRQIFALEHIRDVAVIREEHPEIAEPQTKMRIEGYDISNISGTSAVGSMVVFTDRKPDKKEYRKFRIKTVAGSDDTGMLKEILERRLRNSWTLPHLILIDGGKGQVNTAKKVLRSYNLAIPIVGIAKGPTRRKNEFIGAIPRHVTKKTLMQVRDEAHRFAIQYHKKLRGAKSLTA